MTDFSERVLARIRRAIQKHGEAVVWEKESGEDGCDGCLVVGTRAQSPGPWHERSEENADRG